MAFTDPMFQLGMRLTMTKNSYTEFSDLVNKVMHIMEDEKSVHYALGYIMQSYIHLADRTDSLDSEIVRMQFVEKQLQLNTEESA